MNALYGDGSRIVAYVGGGLDQVTFSDLQMTAYTGDSNNQSLYVFTQGSFTNLAKTTMTVNGADVDVIAKAPVQYSGGTRLDGFDSGRTGVKTSYADVGFYAIGFGAGKQNIGEGVMWLQNYDFTAGSTLSGVLNFKNIGSAAIRYGGANAPIKATLSVVGPDGSNLSKQLASWDITSNIPSGALVELEFVSEALTEDLPVGTRFVLTVSEDSGYFTTGAFSDSFTLLTVQSKPELQFESYDLELKGVEGGYALLDANIVVSNRGNEKAENLFLQFSYEEVTGEGSEAVHTQLPADITGSSLIVGQQELIAQSRSLTENDLSKGIIALKGSDGQGLKKGCQRVITGTIKVPVSYFQHGEATGLALTAKLFSGDPTLNTETGLYTGGETEYNEGNNSKYKSITDKTWFTVAENVSMALTDTSPPIRTKPTQRPKRTRKSPKFSGAGAYRIPRRWKPAAKSK